jgi:hypothetical protein
MATDVKIILSAEDRTRATIEGMIGRLGDMNSAASLVRGGLAQLGAALSVGALVAWGKATIDGVDALNDLKAATGSSIENISALEDVAKRTGTSFDTVGSALIKFNKLLNDAKPGSDAEAALKALNLNIEELKTLDPAEAMRQTAVALSGFADDGNKGRLMLELFGKSTRDVAKFLQDLAEQQKLVATVTTATSLETEKFNNHLSTLKKNAEDSARSIAEKLLPVINRVFQDFNSFNQNRTLASAAADVIKYNNELNALKTRLGSPFNFAGNLSKEIAETTAKLEAAKAAFNALDAARKKATAPALDAAPKPSLPDTLGGTGTGKGDKGGSGSKGATPTNAFDSLNASLDKYLALNQAAAAQEQDLSATERLRISTLSELVSKYAAGNLTMLQFIDLQQKLKRVVDAGQAAEDAAQARKDAKADAELMLKLKRQSAIDMGDEVERQNAEARALDEEVHAERIRLGRARAIELGMAVQDENDRLAEDAAKAQLKHFEDSFNALVKQGEDKQRRLQALYDAGPSATLARQREDIALLTAELEAGRISEEQYLEAVSTRLDLVAPKLAESASLADQLGLSFSSAFEDAIVSGKDFGQVLQGLEQDIIRIVARKLITEPVGNFLSTSISAMLGGISFAGGGYTGAGLRTGGLDGRGGFMAMLHPNETVVDHERGGSAGAGQSVTVVQNFTVGDVASVSLVRQAVANSERRIASSIGRSMSYGGAIG